MCAVDFVSAILTCVASELVICGGGAGLHETLCSAYGVTVNFSSQPTREAASQQELISQGLGHQYSNLAESRREAGFFAIAARQGAKVNRLRLDAAGGITGWSIEPESVVSEDAAGYAMQTLLNFFHVNCRVRRVLVERDAGEALPPGVSAPPDRHCYSPANFMSEWYLPYDTTVPIVTGNAMSRVTTMSAPVAANIECAKCMNAAKRARDEAIAAGTLSATVPKPPAVLHRGCQFEEITHLPLSITLCARSVGTNAVRDASRIQIPFGFDAALLQPTAQAGERWFDLQSVIMHSGDSLKSGHYITYTKLGQQWYCCNDSIITPMSLEDASREVCGDTRSIPYVFTYTSFRPKPAELGDRMCL